MPRVTPITFTLVSALLAAPGVVVAQQDSSPWLPPQARQLPNGQYQTGVTVADTTGIRTAVQANFTEVALGRLADDRASSSAVKDYGKQMVSDHGAMNDQWSKVASKYHMQITSSGVEFGPNGKDAIDRLEKLKGSEFDQAYMMEMIRDHEQDLSEFQRLQYSARDPEIRELAASGVTTIEQHLTLARQVGSQVGVATTAGRVGNYPSPYPAPNSNGNVRQPTTTGVVTNEANHANNPNAAALSKHDRAFVDNVLDDHLLHIRLARVVRRDARLDETKDLARRMEKEMTHWSKRWDQFADRHDADVTSHLDENDRNKIQRIENAKEKNVDHAYAQIVSQHMERMLDNFRAERWDQRKDATGVLAQKEIPVLVDLLDRARKLDRQTSADHK